jgi:hypothetical protein
MTVGEFADLLHVVPGTVSNYRKKGEVPHQYAVLAVLLGDSVDRGVDVRELLIRYRVPVTRVPGTNVADMEAYRNRSKGK